MTVERMAINEQFARFIKACEDCKDADEALLIAARDYSKITGLPEVMNLADAKALVIYLDRYRSRLL